MVTNEADGATHGARTLARPRIGEECYALGGSPRDLESDSNSARVCREQGWWLGSMPGWDSDRCSREPRGCVARRGMLMNVSRRHGEPSLMINDNARLRESPIRRLSSRPRRVLRPNHGSHAIHDVKGEKSSIPAQLLSNMNNLNARHLLHGKDRG